jgi:alkaline phosphatase D
MKTPPRTTFSRRELLKGGVFGALTLPLMGCGRDPIASTLRDAAPPGETPFRHGVASGDPLADRVMLWTRVSVDRPTPVTVEVSESPDFSAVVFSGEGLATEDSDYCVKIDAEGLAPGRRYHYRFTAAGLVSPLGRTRTAPVGAVDRLRFAVVACSQYSNGFFNVYGRIAAREDLDGVIHLGDYLYEGGGGRIRIHEPNRTIVTLDEYRSRYAQYRTDPDLQAVHAAHPFLTIWDDHESTDNSYRDSARSHDPSTQGDWLERKAVSQRAYFEWMPIRELVPGDVNRIDRSMVYGDLAELILLDTRLQRDVAPADFPPPCEPSLTTPERRMLGEAQEAWFLDRLTASPAQWKIVCSGVMFGQWKVIGAPNAACGGQYLNADQWDGYQAERDRVFAALQSPQAVNSVFLAGDIHSAWALDLSDDPQNPAIYNPLSGEGSLAVEFVCNSVTSDFPLDNADLAFETVNSHVKYLETDRRGYLLLDLDRARSEAQFWFVDTVDTPSTVESMNARVECRSGSRRLSGLQRGLPFIAPPEA